MTDNERFLFEEFLGELRCLSRAMFDRNVKTPLLTDPMMPYYAGRLDSIVKMAEMRFDGIPVPERGESVPYNELLAYLEIIRDGLNACTWSDSSTPDIVEVQANLQAIKIPLSEAFRVIAWNGVNVGRNWDQDHS